VLAFSCAASVEISPAELSADTMANIDVDFDLLIGSVYLIANQGEKRRWYVKRVQLEITVTEITVSGAF
jgi:hypothetical protein